MAKRNEKKRLKAEQKASKKAAKKTKSPSLFNRAATLAVVTLAVGSVVQELRKPVDKRTWEGRVVGVPYDYRTPTMTRLQSTWWAPEDTRLLVPTAFGLGWDLNVGRVLHLASNAYAGERERSAL